MNSKRCLMVSVVKLFVLVFVSSVVAQSKNSERQLQDEDLSRLKPAATRPLSTDELGSATQRGVKYLVATQRKNGAWGSHVWTGGVDRDPVPGAFRSFEVAVTALCLEALLGVKPNDEVERARAKALEFLLSKTAKIKRAGPRDLPNVWANCYCIQVFSQIYKTTTDQTLRGQLRSAISQHMKDLKRWESIHGGWFYYGSGMSKPINPSCSFVNSAVLVAIARAQENGVRADQKMVISAVKSTQMMRKPDSTFLYSARSPLDKLWAMREINRPCGSLGRSQVGNLALRLWGDERITDQVIETWLDRLITRHGWLDMGRKRPIPHESHAAVAGYFYYFGVYYGSLCIEQIPKQKRALYQHHLARLMVERQEKDGSWFDYPLYSYHKPYGTAFALMVLQNCRVDVSGK